MMDAFELVRAALDSGARTRKEVVQATGLDAGIVDVAVDVLVRSGAINVHALQSDCGAGGCGSCAKDAGCAPNPNIGPLPLTLRTDTPRTDTSNR